MSRSTTWVPAVIGWLIMAYDLDCSMMAGYELLSFGLLAAHNFNG